jgi:hypothetical protein
MKYEIYFFKKLNVCIYINSRSKINSGDHNRNLQDIPKRCIHIIVQNINLVYTSFWDTCTLHFRMKPHWNHHFIGFQNEISSSITAKVRTIFISCIMQKNAFFKNLNARYKRTMKTRALKFDIFNYIHRVYKFAKFR